MNFRKSRQLSFILVLLLIFTLLPLTTFASGGSFTSRTFNGRTYKIFVPSTYQAGQPVALMVMLHGCTQDPDQFATGTRMNDLAAQENFIVIYPEQTSTANSSKCWNWFETAHQHRGSGEPALIAGMVNQVKANYSIDNDKVFVAGLSAGAAMSVIMGATYPDIFRGIGVGAGLEYKAATTMNGAFTAMSSGGPNPNTQGDLAYNEMTKSTPRVMPTIVFHGTSDFTVAEINGHQVISQWARTNDRADDGQVNGSINNTADITEQGQVPGGRSFTRYAYKDSQGKIVMEKYMVNSMGHAWSGGSSAGSYTDPNGPNATQIMWNFFMGMGGGTTPPPSAVPVTSISPNGGGFVGSINVEIAATNNPDAIYYSFDGVNYTVYTGPLTITETSTVYAKAENTNGMGTVVSATFTKETSATLEIDNNGSKDGYVKANNDGSSPQVGTFTTLAIGPGSDAKQNRAILHFDTSAIPVDATITRAYIAVEYSSGAGDPWTGGTMVVDVKNGFFGASDIVQTDDWAALPTASAVAQISKFTSGVRNSTDFNAEGISAINKGGVTQARLRFNWNPSTNNYIFIKDGATAKLFVQYELDTNPVPVTNISPKGGTFENSIEVTLSATNNPSAIYYSFDGANYLTYTGPLTLTETKTIYAKAENENGMGAIASETFTKLVTPPTTTTTFKSIGSEDGFVGQFSTDGMSTSVLKVGDKGMFNLDTFRTILSFDTSSLNGKTIESVKLRVYRKSLTGNVSGIDVDIRRGHFGTSSGLELGDYSATASALNIVRMSVPTANNDFVEITLPTSALTHINTTGKTQFRLKGVTTASMGANTLEIYGGGTGSFEPQLIVTFK